MTSAQESESNHDRRRDDAGCDHLYRLAGLGAPADGEISDHLPPGLSRLLLRLGDAAVPVSDLRRATGRFPDSRRLTTLIRKLTKGNERFAELWASGAVGAHREDRKIVEHPATGPIVVDCDVIIDGDAERKIVALTATPDSEDETKFRLAILSGVTAPRRA